MDDEEILEEGRILPAEKINRDEYRTFEEFEE